MASDTSAAAFAAAQSWPVAAVAASLASQVAHDSTAHAPETKVGVDFDFHSYSQELYAAAAAKAARIFDCTWMPDGNTVVAVTSQGALFGWQVDVSSTAPRLAPSVTHHLTTSELYCCAAVGTSMVAVGGEDGIFLVQSANPGSTVTHLEPPRKEGPRHSLPPLPEVNGVSSDGVNLFAATGDSCAYMWDLAKATVTQTFSGHTGYLHACKLLPTRQLLATVSEDGTARLWDIRTGKTTLTLAPTDCRWLGCVDVDSSDNWLTVAGANGRVAVYHVGTGSLGHAWTTKADIHALCCDDREVWTGDKNGRLQVWSTAAGQHLHAMATRVPGIFSIKKHPKLPQVRLAAGAHTSVDMYFGHGRPAATLTTL